MASLASGRGLDEVLLPSFRVAEGEWLTLGIIIGCCYEAAVGYYIRHLAQPNHAILTHVNKPCAYTVCIDDMPGSAASFGTTETCIA